MGVRDVLAGKAAVEIGLRDKLQAGLNNAQQRLQDFAVSVAAIGISFQTIAAITGRAWGVIGDVFTGPADQLQNLADQTGLSVQMLQALGESGADSGATLDDVGTSAKAMANFLQTIERDGGGATQSLTDLGITAEQLKAAVSQDDRVNLFADALSQIEDPARRAALAQDVFGKGAMRLLPILAGGAKGIAAFRDKLEEVGGLRSAEAIAAADNIGDAMGRLTRRVKSIGFSAILAIAPAIQRVVDVAVRLTEAVNGFVSRSPRLAQMLAIVAVGAFGVAAAIGVVTGALVVCAGAVTLFSTVWTAAMAISSAATAVFAAVSAPIWLIAAAVAVAILELVAVAVAIGVCVVAFLTLTETGRKVADNVIRVFGEMFDFVTRVTGGIFDALLNADWDLAVQIQMLAMRAAMETGFARMLTVAADAAAGIAQSVLPAPLQGALAALRLGSLPVDAVATAESGAMDELNSLLAESEKKRGSLADRLKFGDVGDMLGGRGGSREQGTFSGVVAGRLAGQGPLEDVAENTNAMRRAMDEINRKIADGKLAVVP